MIKLLEFRIRRGMVWLHTYWVISVIRDIVLSNSSGEGEGGREMDDSLSANL